MEKQITPKMIEAKLTEVLDERFSLSAYHDPNVIVHGFERVDNEICYVHASFDIPLTTKGFVHLEHAPYGLVDQLNAKRALPTHIKMTAADVHLWMRATAIVRLGFIMTMKWKTDMVTCNAARNFKTHGIVKLLKYKWAFTCDYGNMGVPNDLPNGVEVGRSPMLYIRELNAAFAEFAPKSELHYLVPVIEKIGFSVRYAEEQVTRKDSRALDRLEMLIDEYDQSLYTLRQSIESIVNSSPEIDEELIEDTKDLSKDIHDVIASKFAKYAKDLESQVDFAANASKMAQSCAKSDDLKRQLLLEFTKFVQEHRKSFLGRSRASTHTADALLDVGLEFIDNCQAISSRTHIMLQQAQKMK